MGGAEVFCYRTGVGFDSEEGEHDLISQISFHMEHICSDVYEVFGIDGRCGCVPGRVKLLGVVSRNVW